MNERILQYNDFIDLFKPVESASICYDSNMLEVHECSEFDFYAFTNDPSALAFPGRNDIERIFETDEMKSIMKDLSYDVPESKRMLGRLTRHLSVRKNRIEMAIFAKLFTEYMF